MYFVFVLVSLLYNSHTNAINVSLVNNVCDSTRALQLNEHNLRFRYSQAAGQDGYSTTLEGKNQRISKIRITINPFLLHVLYIVK